MEPLKRHIKHYLVENDRDLFAEWFDGLKDSQGQIIILKRIDRVEDGNFGDHSFVGQGVWELRIHFGPGYRVYYGEDGPIIVILLCGGSKRTQVKDIRKAQELWQNYKRRGK
ncbi:MAG: addiction module protein [Elusimicrobia bacterium RIFCSPLOWO2_02_FULL_39_32]|nr:MAG: addiction module protein [Elusimicrobia bacterium GWA2_38_7]OGR80060.1 MAG: addiction module protein [Elusimicrobia bacterium RIFCSPHIGHO2_02_FULL_39_36]OGR91144.1 MAG: addiction module protein [Elusimicrobia bacterium RIFCSPLOWO2_02_FULL_39_32]OGS00112.1 MAG: addiction module protein [Elusimicrobia bacterium RIFCSPLOWO2_12_FULL_39_28]